MTQEKNDEGIKRVIGSPLLALGHQNPLFPISEVTYSEVKKLDANTTDRDPTGIAAGRITEPIGQE